tara:strand:- start:4864 stop:5097 length:234 start_codon:yes stop_codon:yes gene_type:complete
MPQSSYEEAAESVTKKIQELHSSLSPEEGAVLRGILKQSDIGATFIGSYHKLKEPISLELASDSSLSLIVVDGNEAW